MNKLYYEKFQGVGGVAYIDSNIPGPVIGISACVHGGEVTGLRVIDALRDLLATEKIKLMKGKLIFILANQEAYQKFTDLRISHENMQDTLLDDVKASRYIQENMNRCTNEENLQHVTTYEAIRVLELEPICKQLHLLLDIHTTYSPSESIMIYGENCDRQKYMNIFNADEHLIDLTKHISGKPFFDMVERNGGVGMAVESGYELDETGYKVGLENALKLLCHEGVVEVSEGVQEYFLPQKKGRQIHIYDHIVVKNQLFRSPHLVDQPLSHGSIFPQCHYMGYDGENDLYLDRDTTIIMPMQHKVYVGEEFCWLGHEK